VQVEQVLSQGLQKPVADALYLPAEQVPDVQELAG
jgi:hypothetical protein